MMIFLRPFLNENMHHFLKFHLWGCRTFAGYLENLNLKLCTWYPECLISKRHEDTSAFHDWLAELYLNMNFSRKKQSGESTFDIIVFYFFFFIGDELIGQLKFRNLAKKFTPKLLRFINTDDKIWGGSPSLRSCFFNWSASLSSPTICLKFIYLLPDLREARTILLGRLGPPRVSTGNIRSRPPGFHEGWRVSWFRDNGCIPRTTPYLPPTNCPNDSRSTSTSTRLHQPLQPGVPNQSSACPCI